jgi:hypothetical protein
MTGISSGYTLARYRNRVRHTPLAYSTYPAGVYRRHSVSDLAPLSGNGLGLLQKNPSTSL